MEFLVILFGGVRVVGLFMFGMVIVKLFIEDECCEVMELLDDFDGVCCSGG